MWVAASETSTRKPVCVSVGRPIVETKTVLVLSQAVVRKNESTVGGVSGALGELAQNHATVACKLEAANVLTRRLVSGAALVRE